MDTRGYSESQLASAQLHLSRAHAWTRGTRKRDGLAFVIFKSSRTTRDGLPLGYYSTETACTCLGFLHRGRCSHELAIRLEAERARAAVGPRRASYDELFSADEYGTVAAF